VSVRTTIRGESSWSRDEQVDTGGVGSSN